ncbi:hypothetical protein NL676_036126 [Syzygium grande]|nr:hypothetical protein NL676_036126 [Syzygium grande]
MHGTIDPGGLSELPHQSRGDFRSRGSTEGARVAGFLVHCPIIAGGRLPVGAGPVGAMRLLHYRRSLSLRGGGKWAALKALDVVASDTMITNEEHLDT